MVPDFLFFLRDLAEALAPVVAVIMTARPPGPP